MYDAAKRFQRRRRSGQTPVVIHLGDHDPSGIDMTRDIRDRLTIMSHGSVEVKRIALTMTQIEQYQPPPNPAKITDSRAEDYIGNYGYESWELDALEPQVLVDLITGTVNGFIEPEAWNAAAEVEEANREIVSEVSDRWTEIEQYLRANPQDA
jgi:hypothetical protein